MALKSILVLPHHSAAFHGMQPFRGGRALPHAGQCLPRRHSSSCSPYSVWTVHVELAVSGQKVCGIALLELAVVGVLSGRKSVTLAIIECPHIRSLSAFLGLSANSFFCRYFFPGSLALALALPLPPSLSLFLCHDHLVQLPFS